MKKAFSFLTVLWLSLSLAFSTEPTQVFDFEEENFEAEFKQLNEIENFVDRNQGITLDDLRKNNSSLVESITLSDDAAASVATDELPLGVPAFWWGCVLTVIGVVLVYVLTDQDKEATKKALFGCLVSGGVYLVFGIIFSLLGRSIFWF